MFLETKQPYIIVEGMELVNCFENAPVKKIIPTIDPYGRKNIPISIKEQFYFGSESNILFGVLPEKTKIKLTLIIELPNSATKQFLTKQHNK